MHKVSKQVRAKTAVVTEYLKQHLVAKENADTLDELDIHIQEDLTNPSINGRGYNFRTGSTKSEGAASPTIHSENIHSLREEEAEKIGLIMHNITSAIGMLEISRGKTILIKSFLKGQSERTICRDMNISRDTYYNNRRRALLQLYDILVESGQIEPV